MNCNMQFFLQDPRGPPRRVYVPPTAMFTSGQYISGSFGPEQSSRDFYVSTRRLTGPTVNAWARMYVSHALPLTHSQIAAQAQSVRDQHISEVASSQLVTVRRVARPDYALVSSPSLHDETLMFMIPSWKIGTND